MNLLIFFVFNLGLGTWCYRTGVQIASGGKPAALRRLFNGNPLSVDLIAKDASRFYKRGGVALMVLPFLLLFLPNSSQFSLRALIGFDLVAAIPIIIWKAIIVNRYLQRGGKLEGDLENIEDSKNQIGTVIHRAIADGQTLNATLLNNSGVEPARTEAEVILQNGTVKLCLKNYTREGNLTKSNHEFANVEALIHYLHSATSLRVGDFLPQPR